MSIQSKVAQFASLAACFLILGLQSHVRARQFDITAVNPLNAEHTRNDGYQYAYLSQMNASGWVVGASDRFNGTSNNLGRSAWVYNGSNTSIIGLINAEHTSSSGFRDNYAVRVTNSGFILGLASRYGGTSTYSGQSIWVSNGSSTTKIGLTGASFTKSDGFQSNSYQDFNESGRAFGSAQRYNGSATIGQSVWYYNGSTTSEIGLLDTQHTMSNGTRQNEALQSFHGNHVLGTSYRYDTSGNWKGLSAWVSNGSSTTQLGFTDAQYTRADGWKDSRPIDANSSGFVVGHSNQYNGTNSFVERSAWYYNGSSTTKIGLSDTMHKNASGFSFQDVKALSESGHAAGLTERYNGGTTYLGQSAWSYNGSTNRQIGLYSAEHTRNTGRIDNSIAITNEVGGVTGFAERWNGGATYLGRSAWVDNGSGTTKIGLTDAMHTRSNGFQNSSISGYANNGTVSGTSQRFNGSSVDMGQSAWHFDGTTTKNISLSSPEFSRNDGYHNSVITFTNSLGQVVGYVERFTGASTNGQSAWFFDAASSTTFDLTLSVNSSGFGYSRAAFLGENGMVLGEYTLFDSSGTSLGNRAFYFTAHEGLYDLGGLVDLGLLANNWESLSTSLLGNNLSSIAGYGRRIGAVGESRTVFLMNKTSSVPEPASILLLGAATIALGITRMRRKKSS